MPTSAFNIDKLLKGQPVVTRSGLQIETLKELGFPETKERFLTALVNSKPCVWNLQGVLISDNDVSLDLFMDEPVTYYWVPTKEIVDVDPQDENYTQIQIVEIPGKRTVIENKTIEPPRVNTNRN